MNPLDTALLEKVRRSPGVFTVNTLASSMKVRREEALRRIDYLIAKGRIGPPGVRQHLYVRERAPAFTGKPLGNTQFETTGGDAA